jgi:hypothetical protein
MEAAGAVFLPAAGGRNGTNVYHVGRYGFYWSSAPGGGFMYFDSYYLIASLENRIIGFSVRPVLDN